MTMIGSCRVAALFMTFATVADLDSMGRLPCFARPGLYDCNVSFFWKIWSWWVRQLDAAFRMSLESLVLRASNLCLRPNGSEGQVAALCSQKCPKSLIPWYIILSQLSLTLKATGNLLQIFDNIRYDEHMLYLFENNPWIPGNLSTPFCGMFPVSPCGRPRQASLRAQLPTARARLPSRWPVTQRHVIGAKPVVISGFLAVGLAAGVVYQRRVKKRILAWDIC